MNDLALQSSRRNPATKSKFHELHDRERPKGNPILFPSVLLLYQLELWSKACGVSENVLQVWL
ncbi:hypothetical protein KIN20_016406 [Parelaphostrongylus tenuis]|uniref:Uncharacterized protein n=1 Tax=Parelaphostrongylus tenuis TaxID=148309 RepID=A0AAD5N1C6_PARTN|nr:hypothetical protein KIN20_016406 [Parelaphostrongylus tenuis]